MIFIKFLLEDDEGPERKDVSSRGTIKQDNKRRPQVRAIGSRGTIKRIKIFGRYKTKPRDISTQPAGMLGPP